MEERIRIIGGGLAGCEAAWQIARRGVPVELWEMRPVRATEAHVTDRLAELVCSNSFRSDDAERNAVGLLHEELRRADSLVMAAADRHKVPAGQALAVDRTGFADAVQQAIEDEPAIQLRRAEMSGLPDAADGLAIIATGPSPRRRSARRSWMRPARATSPSSTRSRPSSIGTASISRPPGSSPAMTRRGPAATAPPTSTARSTATATTPSSTPCSPPTRSPSGTGSATRPTSRAACPSR